MRIIETAWAANPHPDLADVYAHVKLGDSARQRLARVESLAAKAPGHLESALAVARAAIDASEFAKARAALAPFLAAPTQRVAMLMAELERTEHGDSGRAREWTLRAVRAQHDPVWTADGYVSDRWRPVSPVTGRLDAFQWQTPLAALPSDKAVVVEPEPDQVMEPLLAPPDEESPNEELSNEGRSNEGLASDESVAAKAVRHDATPRRTDGTLGVTATSTTATPATDRPTPAGSAATSAAAPPLFRARHDLAQKSKVEIPAVIPITRAPDDPGIDDERDAYDEQTGYGSAQAGGWRGFVSRWFG